MRQAGRYLPEYRELRAKAGSFLDLCYAPELAAEVTLQPIRRFSLDAAILFSDILVVPHALGQDVRFEEGEGPRLSPIGSVGDLARLDRAGAAARYDRVFETVRRVRAALPSEVALIGFCGAPWTVATYMVAGEGTTDQAPARLWAYRDPAGFAALIDLIVETSIDYLAGQVAAGADCLQLFDSWAGALPDDQLLRWVVDPAARIVRGLRGRGVRVPVIGFPRGAGTQLAAYARETGVEAIGCDTSVPLDVMRILAERGIPVQGNLDPLLLLAGGEAMEARAGAILDTLADLPFVFNLGHGIVPQTPPEHVAALVRRIRSGP
jgi:uroporphyrinogen decarboxylase